MLTCIQIDGALSEAAAQAVAIDWMASIGAVEGDMNKDDTSGNWLFCADVPDVTVYAPAQNTGFSALSMQQLLALQWQAALVSALPLIITAVTPVLQEVIPSLKKKKGKQQPEESYG